MIEMYEGPRITAQEPRIGLAGGQLVQPGVGRQGYAGERTTPIQRSRLRKKFPDIEFDFKKYPEVGVKSTEDDYYRAKRYFRSSEFKTGKKIDLSKRGMEVAGTEKALTKDMKNYLKQRYPRNKNMKKLWMEASPTRRSGWKKNLTTWLEIKDIPGIEKLKGKPGEGKFNTQLKMLKEFHENKPTYKTSSNPKGRPFTLDEWFDASPRVRETGRMTEAEFLKFRKETSKRVQTFMRSQKEKLSPQEYELKYSIPDKEAALKYAKKLHPQRYQPGRAVLQVENNILLNYMTRAAKQQSKNLDKNLVEYVDIEKDGKFLGVRDVKTGTNYYHAQYPKSNLKPGDKLITSHPEYEKVKELKKAASKFKYDLPNKTIASYFSDYKRVPSLGELANFLTRAGIKPGDSKELVDQKINLIAKYSDQSMKANPLHLHHMLSAEIAPTKKIQLRLQDQNDMAGKIVEQVKKGNISKADASKQLKKINVSAKIGETVVGAREDVPVGQQVSVAKRRTTKMFFEALKQRPDLVKSIAKRFGIAGKATAASIAAFMTVNAISPQEALAGETGVAEKAKSWPIEHPWLTGGAATGASKLTKADPLKLLRKIPRKILSSLATPTGALAAWPLAAMGVEKMTGEETPAFDPKSGIERASAGAELAFAPSLVKWTDKLTKPIKNQAVRSGVTRLLNLGMSPAMAMRAARLVSPIGWATLGAEGVYQMYKRGAFDKERMMPSLMDKEAYEEAQQEQFDKDQPMFATGGLVNLTRTVARDSGPMQGLASTPEYATYRKEYKWQT